MTKRKGGYADKQPRYDEYQDWKSEEEYIQWTVGIFQELDKVLVENGVILYNFSYSIENPALPYYYGFGTKVYKIGGPYDRSYGTQKQVTVKKKLFGKPK
jgi:hypothetical protein